MKKLVFLMFLVISVLGTVKAQMGETTEIDFPLLLSSIKSTDNNNDALIGWLKKQIEYVEDGTTPVPDYSNLFTEACLTYTLDLSEYNSGYGDKSLDELRSKYAGFSDVNYSRWGLNVFTIGNGCADVKIESYKILGLFNDGEWVSLTMLGSCQSERKTIVLKIIIVGDSYKIANFYSLEKQDIN